jgi:hypothetical protein
VINPCKDGRRRPSARACLRPRQLDRQPGFTLSVNTAGPSGVVAASWWTLNCRPRPSPDEARGVFVDVLTLALSSESAMPGQQEPTGCGTVPPGESSTCPVRRAGASIPEASPQRSIRVEAADFVPRGFLE